MRWKFLGGAAFLTVALLLPHARAMPVFAGVVLACAVEWGWSRINRS